MPDNEDSRLTGFGHDDRIGAALTALPLESPPGNAWPGVAAEIVRRRRTRTQRRVGFALAAALAVAALIPLARYQLAADRPDATAPVIAAQASTPRPQSVEPAAPALQLANAELIERNQWLEAMLRAQGEPLDGGSAYASAALEDLIGMVDVQLSGTPAAAQQTALWERRLALMQELASVRSQGLPRVAANDAGPARSMPANYQID